MKIVLFHPTLLPPRDYGGVERVVLWLAKGLRDLGHQVWVAAYAGSRLPEGVALIEIDPADSSVFSLRRKIPPGVDLIHFMAPPEDGSLIDFPWSHLLTVHGNGKVREKFLVNSVFLSRNHADRHGAQAFVYNGIDPEECLFLPSEKESSFLFLSKTSWSVKNVKGAVSVCRKAGVGLRIAGGSRPYFTRTQVEGLRILGANLHWEGPVSGITKARLLARAKALLFPVLWQEPFGLVVVEALMSGTPVIATPQGSLPELITSEVGALLSWEDQGIWVEQLRLKEQSWSAEACRERAMKHFHFHVMAKSYENLYRIVAGGGQLNRVAPVTQNRRSSLDRTL